MDLWKKKVGYSDFQIEGGGVPGFKAAVPKSYMNIASEKTVTKVFRCIANAKSGVSDKDIVDNYVLALEYGKSV